MFEERRELFLLFQIDTNRVNARGRLADINRLERWADLGIIRLEMSKVAYDEARRGRDHDRTRKVMDYIYSYSHADTEAERLVMAEIARTLFPRGPQTVNDRNDVEIVFNANKYGAMLVTADGVILDKARELARLGICIMSGQQAVAFVRSRIQVRDDTVRQLAADSRAPVPEWVGKD